MERKHEVLLADRDAITPSAIRLMEALEKERIELGKAFDLNLPPIKNTWGLEGKTLEEAIRSADEIKTFVYKYIGGSHQYLVEDLYFALPPLASIANLMKVPTPAINSLIHIFSIIDGINYIKEGINVEKLGINGLNKKEILKLLENGLS